MNMEAYILDNHKQPVKTSSASEALKWKIDNQDLCRVGEDIIDDITVSTVFLCLDYSYNNGPPVLFETMVFGGPKEGYQKRYNTWEEAEIGHKIAVAMVKNTKDD